MGDVREQRPSGTADTHPYLGKPDGFFGGRAGATSLRYRIHRSIRVSLSGNGQKRVFWAMFVHFLHFFDVNYLSVYG